VDEFLKHRLMIREQGSSPSTNTDTWVRLGEEGSRYYEHARWLDVNLVSYDLGGVLHRDSVQVSASDGAFEKKEAQRINMLVLRARSNFVALTDRQGRFLRLIERQDLLERLIEQLA
jgi:hypothetical protein